MPCLSAGGFRDIFGCVIWIKEFSVSPGRSGLSWEQLEGRIALCHHLAVKVCRIQNRPHFSPSERNDANMPTWNQIQAQLRNPNNPVVFFDVSVGTTEIGRMIFELFEDVCPKTSENFRQFCTGEYRKDGVPLGFKGAIFHRVIKDFMIQGGDFVNGDGTGVLSIYSGGTFPDENFTLKHDSPGLLSMANSGKDTNGCQFFITCAKCNFLDGKHVVFGRVIDGLLVMRKVENVPTGPNNKPKIPVTISQCGQM